MTLVPKLRWPARLSRRLGPLCWLSVLVGCSLTSNSAWDQGDSVPLVKFQAHDGHYFPPFITKVFPGTSTFASRYPSVAQARSDVVLIEVKPLSSKAAAANEANLSWSADGAYLGYEVVSGSSRKILLKDLAGDYSRELQVLPKGDSDFLDGLVVKSARSYNAGLRWSHDSTRFAFMSNGGVGDYGIYVGAVGAKEAQVAGSNAGGKDGSATWSPATNEIAFVSARSGHGDIHVVAMPSGKVSRLTQNGVVNIFPEWFPSGNRLVFSSGDANYHDLRLVERSSREAPWQAARPLTISSRDNLRPTVSPDGSLVAFYCDDPTATGERSWNLVVVPVADGKTYGEADLRAMVVARDVVIDLNTGPAWSPDSRKLFFVKHDQAVANPIHAYDLYTGHGYAFQTGTKMNRDILLSKLGILSFRSQVGAWDRVYVALTNQGLQLQDQPRSSGTIRYQPL